MKNAVLTIPSGTSGLRFEVHSTPSRGHSSVQKWYIKANHPVEATRWITAIQKGIDIAKRQGEQADRRSGESDVTSLKPSSSIGGASQFPRKKDRPTPGGMHSAPSSAADDGDDAGEVSDRREGGNAGDEREDENETSSDTDSTQQTPPHANAFELQGNALLAQVELTAQLLSNLPTQTLGSPRATELTKAIEDTFGGVSGMLTEYVHMVKDREEWYKGKLERERERQNVWEESLQAVVLEGDKLEQELRSRFRRRSRAPSASAGGDVLLRRTSQIIASPIIASTAETVEHIITPAAVAAAASRLEEESSLPDVTTPTAASVAAQFVPQRPPIPSPSHSVTGRLSALTKSPTALIMDDDDAFTDEEDEFFDAIESNTLPNLVITQSLIRPGGTEFYISRELYKGYLKLRDRLAITSDDRPPMSLWAVLKNSIGKDLTKISFPVFFNEPTSMLQRMVRAFSCVVSADGLMRVTGGGYGILRVP